MSFKAFLQLLLLNSLKEWVKFDTWSKSKQTVGGTISVEEEDIVEIGGVMIIGLFVLGGKHLPCDSSEKERTVQESADPNTPSCS